MRGNSIRTCTNVRALLFNKLLKWSWEFAGMAQPIGLQRMLCLGMLFFLAQGALAQCGQSTQQSVSTTPKRPPTPKIDGHSSSNRIVVLQLEISKRGMVRGVEVLGDPGKLRTPAILAAVNFANSRKYFDRIT